MLEPPEESGAHVVLMGGDRVLMAASAPQTATMLEKPSSGGLNVTKVDISEFEKLEGRVTCLSVLIGQ
jgi:dimethylargininase